MKRLWLLILAAYLLLPQIGFAAQTKIYPAPTRFGSTIAPQTNDGAALGTADLSWSDLFLASGAVINAGNGEVTLTFAADTLTLAGGNLLIPNLTAARVVYVGASGLLTDSNSFGFDGTNIYLRDANSKISMGPSDALVLYEEAANILQLGADDAAPTAQTLKGPDGSGANIAGGKMTLGAGRSTGTGTPGTATIAVSTLGAVSNSTQAALVDRVTVGHNYTGFSPDDAASTAVAATGPLKVFAYNKSVVDDGIVTLPAVTTNGYGKITVGTTAATYAQFVVGSTGTVTLLGVAVITTADVVANADTDAKLCIGTAGTQEPLQIKNRLGSTQVLNIEFWYD